MKIVLALCTLLLIYGVYEVVRVYSLATKSRTLVSSATAFSRMDGGRTMLVLGDSTAVCVGATPESSVPGRLSALFDASVENYAVSGARIADVSAQIEKAQKETYDIILIHAGANDVIHGTAPENVRKDLEAVLAKASLLSNRVIVLTAGKIGDAPFIPWFVRGFMNARTAHVRDIFIEMATKYKAVYVDIYSRNLNFAENIPRYYATDQFHLSGEGYGEWFSIVREYAEKNWPELARN